MYVPPAFREDRPAVLHAAIRAVRLPLLIGNGPDGLIASHVPMLLDENTGPFGTLIGHVSRANPHTHATGEALAIFQGPEAYITPSWYATKQATGKVVPTWNYVAVHAAGTLEWFTDPARLLALLNRLTDRFEGERAKPWAVSDAPDDYIASHMKGIVGFVLTIAKLEGKWKMSQNREPEDRAGVAAGLAADGRDDLAALIPG